MILRKLILCTLLFPCLLTAQKIFKFPTQIDKMAQINEDFSIDNVIDVRNASSANYIGQLQSNILNPRTDALLTRPLADVLTRVIHQLLPNGKSSTGLILKVNRLKVWELSTLGTKEAYAFGDFDLILKQDTAYYLVDNYNGFVRKQSGLDVSDEHIKNLLRLLKEALAAFEEQGNWQKSKMDLPRITASDVLTKNKPAIGLESVKMKGTYRHFGEFLNNKPTLPMAYKERGGKKTVVTIDGNGQERELGSSTHIWGFCDGKDIFVCQQGAFFPLKFENNKMLFNGYDLQKRLKKQQTGAFLFGVVGAAVASANKGDLELMEINMDSGECVPSKELPK